MDHFVPVSEPSEEEARSLHAEATSPRAGHGAAAELRLRFWEHPLFIVAAVLACAIPLLFASIPPLTDLPGHMGRYKVELDLAHSAALQHYYSFRWSLIANLGADLLVVPLAHLFGLEPAVRLIVIGNALMTAAGFLLIAKAIHGRLPLTAFVALPFVYNAGFLYGFVNASLSLGLACLSFALWIWLGEAGRTRLRAALFVPIAIVVWLSHALGWGVLGLLCFGFEAAGKKPALRTLPRNVTGVAIRIWPLIPPGLLMLLWRSGEVAGKTGDWFNWTSKVNWMIISLRDRWELFDKLSVTLAVFLFAFALVSDRFAVSRRLIGAAIALAVVYLCMPQVLLGSGYADMRIAPFVIAVALLAIRPANALPPRISAALAIVCLAFFGARMAANAASMAAYDRSFSRNLAALDHVPHGARLVSLVGTDCRDHWTLPRLDHLPALAIVRREAFSNDQWQMPGAQLITVRWRHGQKFSADNSQAVVPNDCPIGIWGTDIDKALAAIPRNDFDYLWIIEPPAYDPALLKGMKPIWRGGSSVLLQITHGSEVHAQIDRASRSLTWPSPIKA